MDKDKATEFMDKYIELCREDGLCIHCDRDGDYYIDDISNYEDEDFIEMRNDVLGLYSFDSLTEE